MRNLLQLFVVVAVCLWGCSDDLDTGRRCKAGDAACSGEPSSPGAAGDSGGGGTSGSTGAGAAGSGIISGNDNALSVHVENDQDMTIEIVTLQCAGDCADIEAVAHGGNPPYTFAWDDGSTNAMRHVCLDASSVLRVQATDTGVQDTEFHAPAQTASAQVTATTVGCSSPGDTCAADGGMQALERLKPDIFGSPSYFAGGATLPAGKYRLTYVDGCLRYQGGGFAGPADDWDWAVQGPVTYQFVIIGDTTAQTFGVPPSAAGQFAFSGNTYELFEDCVTANLASAPRELDFAGGKLGIWQNDFKPEDNVAGPDGRTPTWELSRICD